MNSSDPAARRFEALGHDLQHLDVAELAKQGARLEGCWALSELPRLASGALSDEAGAAQGVHWSVRGERKARAGTEPEIWLHLQLSTRLHLECQRCLKPVEVPLQLSQALRFVHGEDAAAALDAESEDDVLALTRSLDLRALSEDELLLSLPLIPRHADCSAPEFDNGEADLKPVEPANPFALLRQLKPGSPH